MAKKKNPADLQARNFKLLLYPDNEKHVEIMNCIPLFFPEYVGILHDKTCDRKPHYHYLIHPVSAEGESVPVQASTLCRKLGLLSDLGEPDLQFVRPVDGRYSQFLIYMTHLSEPEKEQYNASALFGSASLISDYGRAATKWLRNEFDMSDCILAVLDWIQRQEGIIRMSYFARWICNTPYFKASGSSLVRSCIEEHNNRIWNAQRSEYMRAMGESAEAWAAKVQYPEADPVPPEIQNFNESEWDSFD